MGGFLWGVSDHRNAKATVDFIDNHIYFPNHATAMILVFRCDASTPLMAYDLLSDSISEDADAIQARLSATANTFFQSDLFTHSTAIGVELFGTAAFNLEGQAETWKVARTTETASRAARAFAIAAAVIIPTGYLGYSASSFFKLECGTKEIYRKLSKKAFWAPFRFSAAGVLFEDYRICIIRNKPPSFQDTLDKAIAEWQIQNHTGVVLPPELQKKITNRVAPIIGDQELLSTVFPAVSSRSAIIFSLG